MNESKSLDPREERALAKLVGELRDAPPPKLDWDRIEGSLVRQIELEAARRRRRAWGAAFAAVAAAALLALVFGDPRTSEPEMSAAGPPQAAERDEPSTSPEEGDGAPGAPGAKDTAPLPSTEASQAVADLEPGSRVRSDDEAVSFTLAGVVSWTLSPRSEVVVETVTVPHTLRLRRGRIEAEVVPRAPGDPVEAFAVVAGTTRVAVRGTVFSVARHDDAVTVEVSRGKVAVGATRGESDPRLLVSPASARFSLEGGNLLSHLTGREPQTAQLFDHEDPAEPRQPNAAPPSDTAEEPASAGASSDARTSDAQDAQGEPEAPARLSVSQAQALVFGCLRSALEASESDSKVTISSKVRVVLGPEGAVDAVRFSPPLRPDLQQRCGGALFGRSLEAEGTASFHVQLTR